MKSDTMALNLPVDYSACIHVCAPESRERSRVIEKIVVLFAVIGLGQILGRISLWGVSLGASGVVFVALLAGHFGFHVSPEVGMV
ncbi:MAG TPA: hypothetical protein DDZ90_04100, partial [Planctomycetaceae bacterium]|nr:hypothetical protein [Planctomycetaceae bacterium]